MTRRQRSLGRECGAAKQGGGCRQGRGALRGPRSRSRKQAPSGRPGPFTSHFPTHVTKAQPLRGHSHTPGWAHTDVQTQTSMGECTHTHTHTRLCVYAPTCARAHLHGSVLTCVNTRACCVCTHVHAHTHTGTGSGASLLWYTHTNMGLYCGHRAPRHGTTMLGSRTGAPRRLEGPGLCSRHTDAVGASNAGVLSGGFMVVYKCANSVQTAPSPVDPLQVSVLRRHHRASQQALQLTTLLSVKQLGPELR